MYCANCGAKLDEGSKFCHNCGHPVQSASPAPQQAVPVPVPENDIPVLQAEPVAEHTEAPQSPVQPETSAPLYSQTIPQTSYFYPDTTGEVPAPHVSPSGSVKTKREKKPLRAVIAVIAILAVLVGGYISLFGKGGLPGTDYAQKGREAYESEDYENAVTYLEKAHEKDPDDTEVYNMLFTSHQILALDRYYAGDYAGSEPHLLRMNELSPTGEFGEALGSFYREWLERISNGSDQADSASVLKRAEEYLTESDKTYFRTLFSELSSAEEIAEAVVLFYETNHASKICMLLDKYRDIIGRAIDSSGKPQYAVPFSGRDYDQVVFSPMNSEHGYKAYYGELGSSGLREGIGAIFCYMQNDGDPYLYYYLSNWKNDVPDGRFAEFVIKGPGFSVLNSYQGTLSGGYYDGYINTVFDDGVEYQALYSNGIVTPMRVDEEGRTVIAVATDDSGKYLYSTVQGEDLTQYGVDEY